MKKSYTLVALVSLFGLASCSTTGDPYSGGIFWSPSKCETQYINPLRAQEAQSMARVNTAEARRSELLKKKSRLDAQLKAARQQGAPTSQISSMQAQLDSLQRQVDALNAR